MRSDLQCWVSEARYHAGIIGAVRVGPFDHDFVHYSSPGLQRAVATPFRWRLIYY